MHSAISILTSVKDAWMGIHLDRISQAQPPKLDICKMQIGRIVQNNAAAHGENAGKRMLRGA